MVSGRGGLALQGLDDAEAVALEEHARTAEMQARGGLHGGGQGSAGFLLSYDQHHAATGSQHSANLREETGKRRRHRVDEHEIEIAFVEGQVVARALDDLHEHTSGLSRALEACGLVGRRRVGDRSSAEARHPGQGGDKARISGPEAEESIAQPRTDHAGQQLVPAGVAAEPAHQRVRGEDVGEGHEHRLMQVTGRRAGAAVVQESLHRGEPSLREVENAPQQVLSLIHI